MINDVRRMDAHVQALRQTIRPGSVVADLGTGTGIFALLACQFGARRVYAIEPADVIQVAGEIARANGFGDRITFIQDISTRVELPEKVDVIVSDLRGSLPLHQRNIPSIVDARRRFLAPGGSLIPLRDILCATVVEMPGLYQNRFVSPWQSNRYGLDMKVAAPRAINSIEVALRITPEQLLTDSRCWATLDYDRIESPNVHATETWTVARAGTAHALGIWFDTTLAQDVGFSSGPAESESVYGKYILPLAEPVPVSEGDRITVRLRADLVDKNYVWRWDTCVFDCDQPERPKARFEQSTFLGASFSVGELRQRASSHVPTLNVEGQVLQFVLAQMTGAVSLETISRRLIEEFPGRFADVQEALTQVCELSAKYGRK
jgi:protein arginine N-methyltransferase 1